MKDRTDKPDRPGESRVARRRARVRADLLVAARQVFTRRGYQDATISEIVQIADVAMGTFYLHFRDKEALLIALAGEAFQMLREKVHTVLEQSPYEPVIPLIIRTILRMAYAERELFLLVCAGESHFLTHHHAGRAQEGLAEHFITALQAESNEKQLAHYDPVLLADLLVGMIMRAINWWFEQEEPGPDTMADHILFMVSQGLPSSLLTEKRQPTVQNQ